MQRLATACGQEGKQAEDCKESQMAPGCSTCWWFQSTSLTARCRGMSRLKAGSSTLLLLGWQSLTMGEWVGGGHHRWWMQLGHELPGMWVRRWLP